MQSWNRIKGSGFDVKLGAIIRPFEYSPFRVGLAIHTPILDVYKRQGKKVAIFGLGDQIRYPENFADGIGLLAEVFEEDEATLVGFTSSEGYTDVYKRQQ